MRILALSILLICGFAVQAQETTRGGGDHVENKFEIKADQLDRTNLILVPFEPKLYSSEIDRDIAKKEGLNFQQIRSQFRVGLNNMIWAETNDDIQTINFLVNDPARQTDLNYIYKSIGYQYKPMPADAAPPKEKSVKNAFNKFKSNFTKKKKPKDDGKTRIQNGQIYSVHSNVERYMHTTVFNPAMLKTVTGNYQGKYLLFINQLDIHNKSTDYREYQIEKYKRQIKVHYTIMDFEGNVVYGGAAKVIFSSTTNTIKKIVETHFAEIAKEIISHVPGAVPTVEEQPEMNTSTGTEVKH